MFTIYFKELAVYAKKYTNDIDVAQDITQDVFVKLFEKRETLEIHTSLKSFLYVSVRNRALDHIRSQKRKQIHHEEIYNTSKSKVYVEDQELQEETELQAKVYKLITQLPEKNQKIFKLSRLEGRSNEEIAVLLGISKRTVETHISNALKKLRIQLPSFIKMILFYIWYSFF